MEMRRQRILPDLISALDGGYRNRPDERKGKIGCPKPTSIKSCRVPFWGTLNKRDCLMIRTPKGTLI